ncbi:gallidermin/nisin family lantibiotic [Actinokineospora iranica]|uniref:Lantibiotic, gallidermin/nisin family n=1 Tax=Actinokineospora iranica TaxID=1271860 RepID=A0A1G6ME48_9PSEU|nr:gallidermin/nisin family lantibiotic [Actinokineospora iranica]SDC53842.1 lantibiotic, gallidermin/nisin family [Actinokineospora iranica]
MTAAIQIQPTPVVQELDLFDLDLEVGVDTMSVDPAVTSVSLCTPGCTSPGGGSNCSFCC